MAIFSKPEPKRVGVEVNGRDAVLKYSGGRYTVDRRITPGVQDEVEKRIAALQAKRDREISEVKDLRDSEVANATAGCERVIAEIEAEYRDAVWKLFGNLPAEPAAALPTINSDGATESLAVHPEPLLLDAGKEAAQ